jgi:hypothetical protein
LPVVIRAKRSPWKKSKRKISVYTHSTAFLLYGRIQQSTGRPYCIDMEVLLELLATVAVVDEKFILLADINSRSDVFRAIYVSYNIRNIKKQEMIQAAHIIYRAMRFIGIRS